MKIETLMKIDYILPIISVALLFIGTILWFDYPLIGIAMMVVGDIGFCAMAWLFNKICKLSNKSSQNKEV